MIEMLRVNSTSIKGAGHDHHNDNLHVVFNSGSKYVYQGVTERTFEMLVESLAPGRYINKSFVVSALKEIIPTCRYRAT